jgi:hydroxyethylthiazole kinase-like uncharacterized protein yjeF
VADSHKYRRGHVLVLAGGPWQTGAARLAARAALRIGAGLVTLAGSTGALPVLAAHVTAIMLARVDEPDDLAALLADPRRNALVIGPGLGTDRHARALVETALTTQAQTQAQANAVRAIVLDADALTCFADDPQYLRALIAGALEPVILTPHEGEYARLFGGVAAIDKAAPRSVRAAQAAQWSGAVVVLKGAGTVVACPQTENEAPRVSLCDVEAPFLATAGSGDVLAGMIGGLLAQSINALGELSGPVPALRVFEAVSAAVWLHAQAGARLGPGLIAEDIPESLPAIIAAWDTPFM